MPSSPRLAGETRADSPPGGRLPLMLILLLAAVLRLIGLGWALPGELHRFSYHPDEWQAVETALGMLLQGDANPHFFNYPTFHIYLVALLLKVALALGVTEVGVCYLLARLLSAAMGIATVALVYALGRRLGGPRLGLLAAAVLALLPLHVVNSHYATMDVPLTFWVSLALAAALAVADGRGAPPRRWLLPGAVAVGLAAATKYNGALALGPLVVALMVRRESPGRLPAAVGVTLLAGLVFCLASPYVLLDPAAWPAIRFELLEHPRSSNLFTNVGPGSLFHLRYNAPTALGYSVALAALAGLASWRQRRCGPLWVWLLLGAGGLVGSRELFIRYWLPLLPVLALAAGAALNQPRRRLAVALLAALVLLKPALRTRAYLALLARPDPRSLAAAWCFETIPAGTAVGVDGAPWFWSAPLQPNNGGARTGSGRGDGRYRLLPNPARWVTERPAWVVVNQTYQPEAAATAERLGYRLVWKQDAVAVILPGWREGGAGSPLHDWNYLRPSIRVYQR